jgi:hypothetical protein
MAIRLIFMNNFTEQAAAMENLKMNGASPQVHYSSTNAGYPKKIFT